jgi:nanoRNase/pAp phosphatase (c-di-AMP/oligoRNAs hydrolase)
MPSTGESFVKVRVCFHDKCFDGASSASIFSRFYRERIDPQATFAYTGMTHTAAKPFEDGIFDGDENAIVDFKYSSSPRLTWWFDHHQSAFLTPADAAHFREQHSPTKFFDPDFKSCTKFIATIAAEKFGFDAAPLADLIHWGDVIDGAQFESAQVAVGMSAKLIPEIAYRPLREIVQLPLVARHLPQLLEKHRQSVDVFRERAKFGDGVVFFDFSDLEMDGYNKFIPYFLFPEAFYTVGVTASPVRSKVSVGTNPWRESPRPVNLASLCEKYGGGGHAKVAAISLSPNDLDRARQIAIDIAGFLRRS